MQEFGLRLVSANLLLVFEGKPATGENIEGSGCDVPAMPLGIPIEDLLDSIHLGLCQGRNGKE